MVIFYFLVKRISSHLQYLQDHVVWLRRAEKGHYQQQSQQMTELLWIIKRLVVANKTKETTLCKNAKLCQEKTTFFINDEMSYVLP